MARGALVYLLQPCHMLTLLSIASFLPLPNQNMLCGLASCMMYNPLLALLFADTRSYASWPEVANYWFEHVLLFAAPFIRASPLCAQQEILPVDQYSMMVIAALICGVWHFVVLTPVSILSECNINMVLVPHNEMKFLGSSYRVVMWWFCSVCVTPALLMSLTEFGAIFTTDFQLLFDEFVSSWDSFYTFLSD